MKAQAGLEAMLAIAGLIAFLIIATSILSFWNGKAIEFGFFSGAQSASLECAMVVNAVFSNGLEQSFYPQSNCIADSNSAVKSAVGGKEKTARIVAPAVSNSRSKGKDFVEVKTIAHYK